MACQNKNCCAGPIPPPTLQEAEAFFARLNVPFSFKIGKTKGWRIRSKLAVRGTSDKPLIGLFKEGTHEVIDMPDCEMHHPKINEVIALLKDWMVTNEIKPYDETTGTGDLRYVQFVVERHSNKVQLTLVLNREIANKLIDSLWGLNLWHSIWVNLNTQKTNTIFGPSWRLIHGSEWLWETILDRKFCFKPASFGQANLGAFESLLNSVRTHILPNQNITEFYAGIGVIGICLLDISKNVICTEINAHSKDCFDKTVNQFSSQEQSKIHYEVGSAAQHAPFIQQSDVVIVDPPRKGLDKALLKTLSEATHLKQLIYISCGWDSFQHDCTELLKKNWKLHVVEGYLFFPGSDHIETLAIFKRT